jgi:adenylosuccinate synthase
MKTDMVIDLQYGSTGKGLIAGWNALRNEYDTAVCAFATNAGHTYINKEAGIHVMTQQLPTSIISPTVKNILLGPGSAIHIDTLMAEMDRYSNHIEGKRILIHPHAAIVEDYHAAEELKGMTKIGSTAKGVGEAYIERMRRNPEGANVAVNRIGESHPLRPLIATQEQYRSVLDNTESLMVEGAQGFSLSMYHGHYPYCTSRDVTPWQVAADCGLPFHATKDLVVIGTLRTFPIRVNNRDGWSGPVYPDQREITWDEIGIDPELTTVTKLPRRIFTFSMQQLRDAIFHCGVDLVFLNFANYVQSPTDLSAMIEDIEDEGVEVAWVGMGPDDSDVLYNYGNGSYGQ